MKQLLGWRITVRKEIIETTPSYFSTLKRILAVFICTLFLLPNQIAPANAAYLSDCLYVSSAKFINSSYETAYQVTLNSRCDSKTSEDLNYAGLSFYADDSVINAIRSTYYYNSWGNTIKFVIRSYDLERLGPGIHYPKLKIFVPKDYSNSSINLPSFTTEDPLSCISASAARANTSFNPARIDFDLKNDCSSLSSSAFSGLRVKLKISGYYLSLSEQSIYSLESYGKNFSFQVWDLKPGFYNLNVEVVDSRYQTRSISLGSLTVNGKNSSTSGRGSSSSQNKKLVCSSASGFDKQCHEYPTFVFDICSSIQKASLYQKMNGSWVYLWKLDGITDIDICSDPEYPFYVKAEGESTIKSKTQFKMVFKKTSSVASFTQLFNLNLG
jgi:hypothetical protein